MHTRMRLTNLTTLIINSEIAKKLTLPESVPHPIVPGY
jgi:hypothetical protein